MDMLTKTTKFISMNTCNKEKSPDKEEKEDVNP